MKQILLVLLMIGSMSVFALEGTFTSGKSICKAGGTEWDCNASSVSCSDLGGNKCSVTTGGRTYRGRWTKGKKKMRKIRKSRN